MTPEREEQIRRFLKLSLEDWPIGEPRAVLEDLLDEVQRLRDENAELGRQSASVANRWLPDAVKGWRRK